MQADYSGKIGSTKVDFTKLQTEWAASLAKFVEASPKCEDAPEALLQLGMVSEFLGKDVEAKNWYAKLQKDFADKPQGVKAAGAVKRLDLEGQALKLAGPTLSDPNAAFDLEQLRGKIAVVYYWAGWNGNTAPQFVKLQALAEANQEVALWPVNLD